MPEKKFERRKLLQTLPAVALGLGASTSAQGAIQGSAGAATDRGTGAQQAQGSDFEQLTKLTASDGDADDEFGSAIAVTDDGTTAIIGARYDEDPNGSNAGSAYVFSEENGSWAQQTKLTASDGNSDDNFGQPIEMSSDGTTAIIGADNDENPHGSGAGAAYVFTEENGSWTEQTKLTANDGDSDDRFGNSVAMSDDGTTAIIGAITDDNSNESDAGAAYVFTEESGSWTEQTKLTASDGDADDQFGGSIAMSDAGTTAIVGASNDEDPNGSDAGSAYVFTEESGNWSQQTKLTGSDGDSGDSFGQPVAMSSDGTTAFIGSSRDEDPYGSDAGSAYVFTEEDGTWTEQQKLIASDGDANSLFGISVAASDDGTTVVVGAALDDEPDASNVGGAYVFTEDDGTWTEQTKLTASDGDADDFFGFPVAVSSDGTTVFIGSFRDEDPNGPEAGSAYVFNSRWYEAYVNQNNVVESPGLNQAISDYLRQDLSDRRLNRVISSYLGESAIER